MFRPVLRLALPGILAATGFFWACGDGGNEPTTPEVGNVSSLTSPLLSHVEPVPTGGNPDCADLGFSFGWKIDANAPNGTYTLTNGAQNGVATGITVGGQEDPGNQITISNNNDGKFFDWASTLGIDAVIVKGGVNSNVYNYDPEATSDDGLHSPNGDTPPDISHVEFCYDYELDVEKDANTELTRTYEWEITKDPDASYVGFPGDVFPHDYTITVNRTGFTDSGWKVSGTITIENNTPFDAEIESVSDVVSPDLAAAVDCGVTFPHTLASGATLECTYSSDLPDGADRKNTATVTTSSDGDVGGGEATADVLFDENTTINEVDAEVNVTDDFGTPGDDGDDKEFGPLGDGGTGEYSRNFVCPTDENLYTGGVYTEEVTNTATIDETGDSDDATVDITCYLPAKAKVLKTTTEGDEDIGQFPFIFELYDPDGNKVETKTLNGAGMVTFETGLTASFGDLQEATATWTVKEVLPDGWVSTTDLTCEISVSFPGDAGKTLQCAFTFNNVEKSRVDLLKLTNGLPTTNQTWTFNVYDGPDGFDGTPIASSTTPPADLDFQNIDLDAGATYTICELEVPAGFSTFWQIDTDGDGVGDNMVVPYNPNQDDDPPEDLGNRCVDFGNSTGISLTPGTTLHFVVDNQVPGGAPRTPGYWKNWNRCTGGNQQYTAENNGGWQEGFWLLENVLDPNIGGGIVWDDILDDNLLFPITGCEDPVLILDKRDLNGKKKASDPLHNLATHLLAAQLNFGAGACTTQDVLDAALAAETLLDAYDFDGYGHTLKGKKSDDADLANQLAEYLDSYNNGEFCGDGNG